ncbi:ribonuclease P protein component [Arachidicoccus ginsenosidimutans]|uniref:ribonuclease P protein component n=1 Tax=Arachidicoccus sp. BS20 TaxID=1850526 RepID=UPI0007F058B0|nr:ribonuclease P protein component [Arachidicoccus sp. BS20]
MEKINGLSITEKLKSRKEIDALFAQRNTFFAAPVRVFYSIENNLESEVKAGFGCSKKYFKHAVKRNRTKRLMREAYRTQKHALHTLALQRHIVIHLFFLFSSNELITYKEMQSAIFTILRKLEQVITKHPEQNSY